MNEGVLLFLKSKLFKKIFFITSGIIVILFIVFFSFRNVILTTLLEKKIKAFEERYPAKLIIKDAHFAWITGIKFSEIAIIPNNEDTLFSSKSAYLKLKFLPLLIGNIKISYFELNESFVNISKQDSSDNYSFLLSKRGNNLVNETEKNYALQIENITEKVFNFIPTNFLIRNFFLIISSKNNLSNYYFENIEADNGSFKTPIIVNNGKEKSRWIFEGNYNSTKKIAEIKFFADSGRVKIPMIKESYGLMLSFDTLQVGISRNSFNGDGLHISGITSVNGLLVNHRKISMKDVYLEKTAFLFNFNIGNDFIELDSTSVFENNKLILNPYFLYQHNDSKKFTFRLNNEFSASDFFASLPTGLFTNFEGIQTEGKLKLDVDFYVDLKRPDSLEFDASFKGDGFKVLKYGITDFSMINGHFQFTAYEKGKPSKSFYVDSENPFFTPLEDISTCLREAVLISENGDYYFSDSFNMEAFRLSIAENIKTGKFTRGGSTIDMQLVKNVFLNKNKTIARKLEEILIVWLMQKNNICSKDRKYEVYLNVIEWGPGIYGIHEASHYYFNKKPADLSLGESIFLASIIPKPKWFKHSFDKNGNLDTISNKYYFSTIARLMLEKAIIASTDTINLLSKVKIKGIAKRDMARDTAFFKMDSLVIDDD